VTVLLCVCERIWHVLTCVICVVKFSSDNIDAGGVPRYDPTMSQLFVRVFLFHGMQVIPGSVCMTRYRL